MASNMADNYKSVAQTQKIPFKKKNNGSGGVVTGRAKNHVPTSSTISGQ